jgi:type VI secretion system protein ImpF
MARQESDVIVTQSVLDRLIDEDRNLVTDPPITRAESVRRLRASVRRDLEWLLNTRRTPFPAGKDMTHLYHSLYNYGLPDFSTVSLGSFADRTRLLRSIEEAVAIFEPRLSDPKVNLVDSAGLSAATRMIRFQIDAYLKMDPAPEHVSFDTVLELTNGEYQVKGEGSAG